MGLGSKIIQSQLPAGEGIGYDSAPADEAWKRVQSLRSGGWDTWAPILRKALPAAGIAAAGAWGAHRMMMPRATTWQEERQRRAQRRRWMLMSALGMGALAANATWQHKVNPIAGNNLFSALFMPESSTAAGLAANQEKNRVWTADRRHARAALPIQAYDIAMDTTRYPVIGNWGLWLPAMFDRNAEARVGIGTPRSREEFQQYLTGI